MGLFKPAWMSRNETRARAAVEALADEATLRRVVNEAPLSAMRVKAALKLDDQELFRRLATSDLSEYDRISMALHVDDPAFLEAFIARPDVTTRLGEIRSRINELVARQRLAEERATLAEIPQMDDVPRLVEIATSDYLRDADRPSATSPRVLSAPTRKTTGDEMREAAVARLAELGADAALAEVARSREAQLSNTAERAARAIADQRVLFGLARELDSSRGYETRRAAVGALTDRALLEELAALHTEQRLGEYRLEKLAAMRLQELHSDEVCHGEHDWERVRTYTDEVGEFRYLNSEYRCRRCGAERSESERV